MDSILKYGFIVLIASIASSVFSLDINKDLFGVEFSPYIMASENGAPIPPKDAYTFDNVKTMLKIVSTKFKRVLTISVDAHDVPYVKNHTYYYGANIRARTAKAAALINRETNNKSLTVMIGVWNHEDWNDNLRWNSEVHVAVEAAQIANSIYPGTVEEIFLTWSHNYTCDWLNTTLRWITKLWSMTGGMDLKIGTNPYCPGLYLPRCESDSGNFLEQQNAIQSDIIVCRRRPSDSDVLNGVNSAVLTIRSRFYRGFNEIRTLKPELQIIGLTYWPTTDYDSANVSENLKIYWEGMNQMANEEGIKVYLRWAIEYTSEIEMGWWRLTNNSLINKFSGYVETISGKPVDIKEIIAATRVHAKRSNNLSLIDELKTSFAFVVCSFSFLQSVL